MTLLINTFLAGMFYFLAGTCGLIRHFLLEPKLLENPKTPPWLLRIFFGFSVIMLYVGMRFLSAWYMGATTTPPGATSLGVLLATITFVYKASLLYDTMTRKASYTLDELIARFRKL